MSPFQGWFHCGARTPRALPWATLECPVGVLGCVPVTQGIVILEMVWISLYAWVRALDDLGMRG
jgi:hypothetical protein